MTTIEQIIQNSKNSLLENKTKITLPAFLYQLESQHFSHDLSNLTLPTGLLDTVKNFLKEDHPDQVRRTFGDLDERKKLKEIVSHYISSKKVIDEYKDSLGGLSHSQLVTLIDEDIAGFGAIDPLFSIPTLTDININGPNSIWIDDYLHGPSKTDIQFKNMGEYHQLLAKMMNAANTGYSLAKPQASGALPRIRFDILGYDISEFPTCSMRIISKKLRITKDSFIKRNQGNSQMLTFLEDLMHGDISLTVSGATGSGKTELMRFLFGFIPNDKRIITIEDLKELYLEDLYPEKNIVSWVTRYEFFEQKNPIDLSKLVKTALRHFPKWLGIGETRGNELYHMVEAAQTGHNVLTGIHSEEGEVVERMITILQDYLPSSEELYGKKIVKNLPINIHNERIGKQRIITSLSEFTSYKLGKAESNILFKYDRDSKQHIQTGLCSPKLWERLSRDPRVNLDKISFLSPQQKIVVRSVTV